MSKRALLLAAILEVRLMPGFEGTSDGDAARNAIDGARAKILAHLANEASARVLRAN